MEGFTSSPSQLDVLVYSHKFDIMDHLLVIEKPAYLDACMNACPVHMLIVYSTSLMYLHPILEIF